MDIYERLTNDLNNKVEVDMADALIISNSSKYRPMVFGDNRNNSCGTLEMYKEEFIYQPERIQQFQEITAGYYHMLGIDKNGALWSWGKNK